MSRVPQPPLSELLGRYLQDQARAHASGMAVPETFGEVLPHDAAPAQPIDPRTAWDEAKTVLDFFRPGVSVASPPDWPAFEPEGPPLPALPLVPTVPSGREPPPPHPTTNAPRRPHKASWRESMRITSPRRSPTLRRPSTAGRRI